LLNIFFDKILAVYSFPQNEQSTTETFILERSMMYATTDKHATATSGHAATAANDLSKGRDVF
jgi:hypothetical protein